MYTKENIKYLQIFLHYLWALSLRFFPLPMLVHSSHGVVELVDSLSMLERLLLLLLVSYRRRVLRGGKCVQGNIPKILSLL